MAKVKKIPEKLYLVVSWRQYENGSQGQEVSLYNSLGQARGEKTRQFNEWSGRIRVKEFSVLIYETACTWELHPDTLDVGMQTLLNTLAAEEDNVLRLSTE